jgi:hypothetical protein
MDVRRLTKDEDSVNVVYQMNGFEFSPAFHIPDNKFEKEIKNRIRVSADICRNDSIGQNRLLMIFSAEVDNKSYHYVTADINEQLQQNNVWYKTEFIFAVPDELKPGSVIKNYIWNIDKKNVLMDNFKIEIAKQTGN